MRNFYAILVAISVSLFSGNALAVTVDFDSDYTVINANPSLGLTGEIVSKGFLFDPLNYWETDTSFDASDAASFYSPNSCPPCVGPEFTVTTESGSAFNLASVDVRFTDNVSFPGLTVTGYYEGGGTISKIITDDAWHLETFDSQWTNLSSVTFEAAGSGCCGGGSIDIDNFTATVVPVPAAVWLFGSALAGLGFLRRRVNAP